MNECSGVTDPTFPSGAPSCVPALTTHDREPSRSRTQSAFSWHWLGVPSGQKRCARGRQPDSWSPTKPGWHGPHWKEPCARAVGSQPRSLTIRAHPRLVSPSFPSPAGPYPGVDAHGIGNAVMLPSLTLVNVCANLGGRERRSHHRPQADTAGPVLRRTLPPGFPPDPGPHILPLEQGKEKAAEAGGRVYSTKCAPPPRPRPPPTGAPIPQGQGPHLLVGLGESQPHALVGGAAVPGGASLAAEAGADVDAADAGKAGMGVTLGEEGQHRIRGRQLGTPRAEAYGSFILESESPRAIIQHLRGCHGAEAIVPGIRCDFV